MPSNHLILCYPLLLLPSIFPSNRIFPNESVLRIRWPVYWSFSFSPSLSNEYSGLISFMIDWFDLLAVQEILKSSPVPQFESIISSVLNLLYGPTLTSRHDYWKNHNFDYDRPLSTKWCLCFLICFLGCHRVPSRKQASLNTMAIVTVCSDFGTQENKICHCFHCFPIYLWWSDGTRCHDLSFLEVGL